MEASTDRGRFGTNLMVGLLALVTIAILAVVSGFLLEKKNPFLSRYVVSARFDDVGGLKVGDPVALAGRNVGSVGSIRTSPPSDPPDRWPDPGYMVELQIEDRQGVREWIRKDSTFQIINDNLFGNRRVDISFGRTGDPLIDGAEVDGEVASGIQDLGRAVENVRAVTDEIRVFILGDGESQPAISDSLRDLQETLENTAAITERLQGALEGEQAADMGKTLRDLQAMAENMRYISESTRDSVEGMRETVDKLKFWRWFSGDDDPEEKSAKESDANEKTEEGVGSSAEEGAKEGG